MCLARRWARPRAPQSIQPCPEPHEPSLGAARRGGSNKSGSWLHLQSRAQTHNLVQWLWKHQALRVWGCGQHRPWGALGRWRGESCPRSPSSEPTAHSLPSHQLYWAVLLLFPITIQFIPIKCHFYFNAVIQSNTLN